MNYNLDLFWYKMVKTNLLFSFFFKLFFNHSGVVLTLSKGPEHPKQLVLFFFKLKKPKKNKKQNFFVVVNLKK